MKRLSAIAAAARALAGRAWARVRPHHALAALLVGVAVLFGALALAFLVLVALLGLAAALVIVAPAAVFGVAVYAAVDYFGRLERPATPKS